MKKIVNYSDIVFSKIHGKKDILYWKEYDTVWITIYHNGKFDISGNAIEKTRIKYIKSWYSIARDVTRDDLKNRLVGTLYNTQLYFIKKI
jgi:hypothetical protein